MPKRTRQENGLPGDTVVFLSRDEALAMHSTLLERFRATPGVRCEITGCWKASLEFRSVTDGDSHGTR